MDRLVLALSRSEATRPTRRTHPRVQLRRVNRLYAPHRSSTDGTLPDRRSTVSRTHPPAPTDTPAQYRLSAPCTFTNQTIAGMRNRPNGTSHSPVQPVAGGVCPARVYIFPTSEGMTKAITGPRRIQMTSP